MYSVALREKEFECGLSKNDIVDLYDILGNINVEALPIELEAREHECSAVGFITIEAAESFDYNYESSGLRDFIANILDDMSNETEDCTYEFKGIKIWLSR